MTLWDLPVGATFTMDGKLWEMCEMVGTRLDETVCIVCKEVGLPKGEPAYHVFPMSVEQALACTVGRTIQA